MNSANVNNRNVSDVRIKINPAIRPGHSLPSLPRRPTTGRQHSRLCENNDSKKESGNSKSVKLRGERLDGRALAKNTEPRNKYSLTPWPYLGYVLVGGGLRLFTTPSCDHGRQTSSGSNCRSSLRPLVVQYLPNQAFCELNHKTMAVPVIQIDVPSFYKYG